MFKPNLDPEGDQLHWQHLGGTNYGVVAGRIPLNNSGVIRGLKSTLVIDSQISPSRASELLALVEKYKFPPIRYLVNTNFHGDHTFGNIAFPEECIIVAHHNTKSAMIDFSGEKHFIKSTLNTHSNSLNGLKWRQPSLSFDSHLTIDLGSLDVDLFFLGAANTHGDICVYESMSQILYTGNLIVGHGLIPNLGCPSMDCYISALEHLLAKKLSIKTILPGHGFPCTSDQIQWHLDYLLFLKSSPPIQLENMSKYYEYVSIQLDFYAQACGNYTLKDHLDICVEIHAGNLIRLGKFVNPI